MSISAVIWSNEKLKHFGIIFLNSNTHCYLSFHSSKMTWSIHFIGITRRRKKKYRKEIVKTMGNFSYNLMLCNFVGNTNSSDNLKLWTFVKQITCAECISEFEWICQFRNYKLSPLRYNILDEQKYILMTRRKINIIFSDRFVTFSIHWNFKLLKFIYDFDDRNIFRLLFLYISVKYDYITTYMWKTWNFHISFIFKKKKIRKK